LYATLHQALHARIAEGTRCAALCAAIEQANALPLVWASALGAASGAPPRADHAALAGAVCGGNAGEARRAACAHVARGLEETLRFLEPYFRMRRAHGSRFRRQEPASTQSNDRSTAFSHPR
jgi:DNA-binding GntR family transcriptional regulator